MDFTSLGIGQSVCWSGAHRALTVLTHPDGVGLIGLEATWDIMGYKWRTLLGVSWWTEEVELWFLYLTASPFLSALVPCSACRVP